MNLLPQYNELRYKQHRKKCNIFSSLSWFWSSTDTLFIIYFNFFFIWFSVFSIFVFSKLNVYYVFCICSDNDVLFFCFLNIGLFIRCSLCHNCWRRLHKSRVFFYLLEFCGFNLKNLYCKKLCALYAILGIKHIF